MANTRIQIKRSSIAGRAPLADQLDVGELAINLADHYLYSKDAANNVFAIAVPAGSGGGEVAFGNFDGGEPDTIFGGVTRLDAGGV
jgi:hypothetical protein